MNKSDDSGSPANFYFNGHELSKWTGQWHLCGVEPPSPVEEIDWDEYIRFYHIWKIQCRLDHVGVLESADPDILHVCCQEMLLHLLKSPSESISRLEDSLGDSSKALEAFEGLVSGASTMIYHALNDGFAVWTSGHQSDRGRLDKVVAELRVELVPRPSVELPHIRSQRSDLRLEAQDQLRRLRQLAQGATLNKKFRQLVNQLPAKTTSRVMQPEPAAAIDKFPMILSRNTTNANQAVTGLAASCSVSKREVGDNPQPEAEWDSR